MEGENIFLNDIPLEPLFSIKEVLPILQSLYGSLTNLHALHQQLQPRPRALAVAERPPLCPHK